MADEATSTKSCRQNVLVILTTGRVCEICINPRIGLICLFFVVVVAVFLCVFQVLASMKKRKAQELGTAEREQIAQEFMFKINQAAEEDEQAVRRQSPALNKLKMLPVGARRRCEVKA